MHGQKNIKLCVQFLPNIGQGLNFPFMEPCIDRCEFYVTNGMQLIQYSLFYQRSTCFGRGFRPSSGAYKTVCAALGIVMLSCCLPLV